MTSRSQPPPTGRRLWYWTACIGSGIVGVALLAPRALGIAGWWGVAQAVSFRGLVAAGLLLAAVVLVVLRSRRRTAALAVIVALAGLGQVGVLAWRSQPDPTGQAQLGAPAEPGDLVVVSANTFRSTDSAGLAAMITARGAAVAVLPETDLVTAQQVAAQLRESGGRWQVFGEHIANRRLRATALLVRSDLGTYELAEIDPSRRAQHSFVVRRVGAGSGPAFIGAVHPSNPLTPGTMADWERQSAWAVDACERYPGMVLAGDFNTTVDHPAFAGLQRCRDAASVAGAEWQGTWPRWLPRALATPIDHVLVDATQWQVVSLSVVAPAPGSDHRALVAHLRPAP